MPIDYSKTKIYKIYSHFDDKIYVGKTTCNYLSQRMSGHRSGYKSWKKGIGSFLRSYALFQEHGIDNFIIELLETKSCNTKEESSKLEGSYIRSLECVNKVIPGRTDQEYYQDNKERFKTYYQENKEEIKETVAQYREDNKDLINQKNKIYDNNRKEEKKVYYAKNKELIKERRAKNKALKLKQ
jgi:hypothetical protein